MKNNISVTYMSGEYFCKNPMIQIYSQSIAQHFDGSRFILTHEMGEAEQEMYKDQGFHIVLVPKPKYDLFRYRWKAFYDFLVGLKNIRYVFITDCKDVLWQRNPIEDLEKINKDHFVLLCDEGVTYQQSQWNLEEYVKLKQSSYINEIDMSNKKVINAGIIAGTYSAVKRLTLFINIATILNQANITDQCYLNYLHYAQQDGSWIVADPDINPFCATGETVANFGANISWDGKLKNSQGKTFALFHQWNRTGYRSEILNTIEKFNV